MKRLPFIAAFAALFNPIEITDNRTLTRGKTYTSSDMESMLREMTGKSKKEARKKKKKYGRK